MSGFTNVRSPDAGEGSGGRTCTIDGCGKPRKGRGYCSKHYARFLRHGDPHVVMQEQGRVGCEVPGCDNPHHGQGLCRTHSKRYARYGTVDRPAPAPFEADFPDPPDLCVDCEASPPMPGGVIRCETCLRADLAARVRARDGGMGKVTGRPECASGSTEGVVNDWMARKSSYLPVLAGLVVLALACLFAHYS